MIGEAVAEVGVLMVSSKDEDFCAKWFPLISFLWIQSHDRTFSKVIGSGSRYPSLVRAAHVSPGLEAPYSSISSRPTFVSYQEQDPVLWQISLLSRTFLIIQRQKSLVRIFGPRTRSQDSPMFQVHQDQGSIESRRSDRLRTFRLVQIRV